MSITKLYAGVEGDPQNSSGPQIRDTINQLIDVHVNSLKTLPTAANAQTDTVYNVIGFYANTQLGGGRLVWVQDASKSLHNGVTYYAPEALTAWNGTQAGLSTLFSWTGTGNGVFARLLDATICPEMAGACGDFVADDTASINAAINYVESIGGAEILFNSSSTYKVSNIGAVATGRAAAILLKPSVVLNLNGSTIKRAIGQVDFDIIYGSGSGAVGALVDTMGIKNGKLDGSATGNLTPNSTDGFNIWLYKIKNPICQNIESLDAANWGVRIQECEGGTSVGNIKCQHKTDINADGVHFIDCKDMTGHGFEIFSSGDDGFIVEASTYGCSNLDFSGIVCKTPQGGIAGGRGVLVFREINGGANLNPIEIKNIKIQAIVTDAGGSSSSGFALAVSLANCKLINSVFDITSSNCQAGARVRADGSGYPGEIRSCKFILKSYSQRSSVAVSGDIDIQAGIGIIDDNTIDASTIDTPQGRDGIVLGGSRWGGRVTADYLIGSKLPTSVGINLYTTNSNIEVSVKSYSVPFRVNDLGNTFRLGRVSDAGSGSPALQIYNPDNIFVGGFISGSVTGATSSTRFIGTSGVGNALLGLTDGPIDPTEGRVPFIRSAGGIYGLGAGTLPVLTDMDATITRASFAYAVSDATTTGTWPTGYTGFNRTGVVEILPYDGGLKLQRFFSAGKMTICIRRYISGSWGNWKEITPVDI